MAVYCEYCMGSDRHFADQPVSVSASNTVGSSSSSSELPTLSWLSHFAEWIVAEEHLDRTEEDFRCTKDPFVKPSGEMYVWR